MLKVCGRAKNDENQVRRVEREVEAEASKSNVRSLI
jgi:hypothetical protein